MRKYLYLPMVLSICCGAIQAQQLVFDPAVVSTLVVNHTAQQEALKDIKDNEGQILMAQRSITFKMGEIRRLEEKMYNSLKSVQAIVGQSKNIVTPPVLPRTSAPIRARCSTLPGATTS
jgi:hypothetical protein